MIRYGLDMCHLIYPGIAGRVFVRTNWSRVLLLATIILVSRTAPAAATEAWRGAELFRQYCASCHGEKGTGKGPVAAYLTVQPADLTRIAERRDGTFPRDQLTRIIAGEENPPGHGTRTMPVWGERLLDDVIGSVRKHRRGRIGRSWYVDETSSKVKGCWTYLYRAIDRGGDLVDIQLSEKRDKAAAEAFFQSARTVTDSVPERVTSDGHEAYPGAIKAELGEAVRHRTNRYLNNHLEQDQRGIKQRTRPMGGFKGVESAQRLCRVHDEVRNFLRPRSRRNEGISLAQRRLLYTARTRVLLTSLAAV